MKYLKQDKYTIKKVKTQSSNSLEEVLHRNVLKFLFKESMWQSSPIHVRLRFALPNRVPKIPKANLQ